MYDVIVVGLGGMGSATAYQLALRGKRVLGLERHGPAHALGSSHGYSRIIRQAYFEDPAYVPLLRRAYELWEQIERESGQHLMTLTGGLMIGHPDTEVVRGSIRSAKEHHLPHEILDARDLRRRFPQFNPDDRTIALYEQKAGFVMPEASVQAHLDRAVAHGAELRFHEPVLGWQAHPVGDGVTVQTAHGEYTAARLVLAPGAWASGLLKLDLALPVERAVLYWFAPAGGPAAFAPDRFPIYIWEVEGSASFYGFPAQHGPPGGVKVAFFRTGEDYQSNFCTPDTIDRTVHPHEVERMRAIIADRIPALNGPLVHATTCMYTDTADSHFVVALHPAHRQVVVASPCSGHGYKFASVMGEILADLALEGITRHPIGLFDPARLMR